MILHFLNYDNNTGRQFLLYVISQFSQPEMCSDFVVMTDSEEVEGIQLPARTKIINPKENRQLIELVESLTSYSGVILHGIFSPWCETVLQDMPQSVTVAWMFWGGDLYDRDDSFLAPISKMVNRLRDLIRRKTTPWMLPLSLYRRIDYCLTGVEEEFRYAKHFFSSDRLKFIWYTYYSIEDTVGGVMDLLCGGDNIWMFNSSALSNNPFDAIARCILPSYRRHFKNRSVYMPLSYGAPWVRNLLLTIGRFVFRTGFHPLVNFLPRDEYNRVLLGCSTIILPHFRPAAQGNILTALWLGMRVYLSEKSMAYTFFKRIGVNIYSFESDFSNYGCERLSKDQIQKNREVLNNWYGKNHVKQACYDVVAALK